MSFSFSKEAIEELKNQIDIVDVIGRSVELKRAGANYKGLCPFHNSFFYRVSSETDIHLLRRLRSFRRCGYFCKEILQS